MKSCSKGISEGPLPRRLVVRPGASEVSPSLHSIGMVITDAHGRINGLGLGV